MVGLFVWVYLEDLTNAIVVIPLLEKFFLVSIWVSLYEVLKLRQVRSEQDTTAMHGEVTESAENNRRLLRTYATRYGKTIWYT
jgi:hypothetical protein